MDHVLSRKYLGFTHTFRSPQVRFDPSLAVSVAIIDTIDMIVESIKSFTTASRLS